MDSNFLELIGNVLIGTAKSKRQMDDMFKWLQKGVSTTGYNIYELPPVFKTFYGLDQLSEKSNEYKQLAEKSIIDFQNSFKEYMSIMGLLPEEGDSVSKEKYLALKKKYEQLKEKNDIQEETIKNLRRLINGTDNDPVSSIQDIIKSQSDVFHKMIKGFGSMIMPKDQSK